MTRPLLHLSGVGKVWPGGHRALGEITLTVPGEPQFISLLGPSGCGKSTLLRLIAGLDMPSEGRIDWPDAQHDAQGQALPNLGYVFQEPTLMPWASVFDNVWLPLRIAGQSRKQARDSVMEALAMVGLGASAQAYPRALSGGMRMRVSIARALATRPRVLLMDEPFAALDEITRHRLNDDLLGVWQASGATVIFVTHSVYESVYLSTRILTLGTGAAGGRIISDLAIDAPYPRGEAFRTSACYNAWCRAASQTLHTAMGDTP